MTMVDVGNYSLAAAVLTAVGAFAASVVAGLVAWDAMLRVARWLIVAFAVILTISCWALLDLMLTDQFQVAYVASYSERALPTAYKMAAFWAGQSGSLLLWAWLLALMSAFAVVQFRRMERVGQAAMVATLAIVCGFFACLMLMAGDNIANPFNVINPIPPADGRGLNPMLQDPGMIAHPPLLFIGYAGYTIPLALLMGALVSKEKDHQWIGRVRRWSLVSWLFLTAGIVWGAEWAYVELGWGGYWAWDPVENASLLPWFTGTALLHCVNMQYQHGKLKMWNAVLIASTFVLCILGTYLTRSGVVASVHSFGESPISQFFLWFLAACIVGSGGIILWRSKQLLSGRPIEGLLAKDGMFMMASVLLVVMMLITLVGTVFPLLSSVFRWLVPIGSTVSEPIVVKQEFYNKVVLPLGMLLLAMMAVGPLLGYAKTGAGKIVWIIFVPVFLIIATEIAIQLPLPQTMSAYLFTWGWTVACIAIAVIAVFSIGFDFSRAMRARRSRNQENLLASTLEVSRSTHRRYGAQLTHIGVVMMMIGIVGSSLHGSEKILQVSPGETFEVNGHSLTFGKIADRRYANYTAVEADVTLNDVSDKPIVLRPQKRFYNKSDVEHPNTEVAMHVSLKRDVYVTLAGWEAGGQVVSLQVLINPLVVWIWIGGIVVAIGCVICLLPRLLPKARKRACPAIDDTEVASGKVQPELAVSVNDTRTSS